MAAFAKATFDTAIYAAFRPTYPRQLFDFIFRYHERSQNARWDTAVDVGCGTGQATTELNQFKRVIGVDSSAKMVDGARKHINSLGLVPLNKFEFIQSGAEGLPFVEQSSVDLLVAAQAAHWFDWAKFWPECARVLRPHGTAAFWIYSEFRFTHHPSTTPLINAYTQGTDPVHSLGPYWQQPGRSIVDNHLTQVPTPTEAVPGQFSDFERVYFTGPHYPFLPSPLPVIMRKQMSWANLLSYLHTWSSLHTYHQQYPSDLERPDGDVSKRFWMSLKHRVGSEGGGMKDEDLVDIEWPVALMLVKKV
jgi:SAM-dependent methyltransferase